MRNTRKSGQILRSKKRPRPTLRSGRGSRTNSNTSHQILARAIEADTCPRSYFLRRTFSLRPFFADLSIKGLSQRELADKVGVEVYTLISQLESGRGLIPQDRQLLWADALEVEPHEYVRRLASYYDPRT